MKLSKMQRKTLRYMARIGYAGMNVEGKYADIFSGPKGMRRKTLLKLKEEGLIKLEVKRRSTQLPVGPFGRGGYRTAHWLEYFAKLTEKGKEVTKGLK